MDAAFTGLVAPQALGVAVVTSLLSDHWHAVRHLRPQLREGIEPLHRRLRGKAWVLLLDPVSQRFHRMTPAIWQVLALLDGRRTLDEVWQAACVQAESAVDSATASTISQNELVQLMSTLHANDLLQSQVSPDASEVYERHRRQDRVRIKQTWMNPMSVRIPLLHPDAWFQKRAALARMLFTWPFLFAWLALVTPAAVLAWQNWTALTENLSDRVLSASNLALLWFIYPIVKGIHEWAHGMAVKAWGGTVREIGVMFILFTPVPYVDASSSYRFTSKWARAAVAAAGIMAELLIGAVAMYVWVSAQPGLVTAIAFNVVLIAGVSTLLVNGNPLMRYDGYFIACDLLELPNMAQRATQYRSYLIDRFIFGAHEAKPPAEIEGERLILAVYGAVAPIYQLLMTFGVILFVASEYLMVGAVMALMASWSALVIPVWKGWKHLTASASLARHRESAMRRSLVILALAVALLMLVPVPFHTVHQAVVWLPEEAIVRAEGEGHVSQVQSTSEDLVVAGQLLLTLDSPQLQSEMGSAAAGVAYTLAALRKAETDEPARAAALRNELMARQAKLDAAVRRVANLDVAARVPGRWTPAIPTELLGRYVKRGEVLGYVVDGPSTLVRVAITQEDMDVIRSRLKGVEVRLANSLSERVPAKVRRQVPGGEFDLVSAALGTSGGGEVPIDPAQTKGVRSLQRIFDMEIELAHPSPVAVFGDRAYVRFDLGATPLARQWFLRLRQVFLSRLNW